MPAPAVLAQPDTELREPSHSSEDQVSGSDTVLGTHRQAEQFRAGQRKLLHGPGLRYQHPPGRQRPVPALPQLASQLTEQPAYAVLPDCGQGDLVDARRTVIPAHCDPRAPQNIPAADLVKQRVERPPGIGLGRPVQRMLQGTDRIGRDTPARSLRGGTSLTGTHRAPPWQGCARAKQRPFPPRRLCCPAAQPVLRPPPTPTRPADHFPVRPVIAIGRHAPAAKSAGCRAGEGLPSSRRYLRYVPRPIRWGVPHGYASRLFAPSMAFATPASSSSPAPRWRRPQAGVSPPATCAQVDQAARLRGGRPDRRPAHGAPAP